MKLEVPVTATGYGSEKTEIIELNEEELRQIACDKLREKDASPNIFSVGEIKIYI